VQVCGVTRTGKGKWVIEQLRKKRASLVWDLKADSTEYPCNWRARNIRALAQLLATDKNPGMVCFSGAERDISEFCNIALLFAEIHGINGAIAMDETSDITGSGKALGSYGKLIRTGLSRGADIYGMCQRAAESDKTTIANASLFHFSKLGTPADRKFMADTTGVPLAEIEKLRSDFEKNIFDCIDCEPGHWWQKSQLQFRNGKAVFKTIGTKTAL